MTLSHKQELWLDPERYRTLLSRTQPVIVQIQRDYRCLTIRDFHEGMKYYKNTLGYTDFVALRDVNFVFSKMPERKKQKSFKQLADIRGILCERETVSEQVAQGALTQIYYNPWSPPHFKVPADERPLRGADQVWIECKTLVGRRMFALNPVFA